ncbi:MAG: hypothetical protein AAF938_16580 [Myxococcota bacterium]
MFLASPTVSLRAPRVLTAGEKHRCTLKLECSKDLPVNTIRVDFVCVAATALLMVRRAELEGKGVLEAGTNELDFVLKVPKGAPASFTLGDTSLKYELRVHVDIPWWPDVHPCFDLRVRAPSQFAVAPRPRRFRSARAPGRDYAELALDGTYILLGQELSGTLAVFAKRASVTVDLLLVARTQGSLPPRRVTVRRERFTLPGDGRAAPFRLAISDVLTPSTHPEASEAYAGLRWRVVVASGGVPLIDAPLTILPRGSRLASEPMARAAPEGALIGRQRLEARWARAGGSLGLRMHEGALIGERGRCSIHVAPANVSDIAVELSFPPVGLNLEVVARRERTVWPGAARVGDGWFEAFTVQARDRDQAIAALGWLPSLKGLRLSRLDDASCTLLVPAPEQEGDLEGLFQRFVRVAEELDRWNRRMPLPASMRDTLDTWQDFAKAANATLRRADLRAVREDAELRLVAAADLAAPGLFLEVRGEGWSVDAPLDQSQSAELPEALRAAFRRLCDSDQVRLSDSVFRVRITGKRVPDAEDLKRLQAMAKFVRQLRRSLGAYR